MNHRYDLHCHSSYSDGTFSPKELVRMAARAKLALLALTDHDCVDGVPEAMAEGKKLGVNVLPAVEMDNEWLHELHILGLGVDIHHPAFLRNLETARQRREKRNQIIFQKLEANGVFPSAFLSRGAASVTKLHIALALVEGGWAEGVRDAFLRWLRQGAPGYYTETRFTPKEVIAMIRDAGGVPVLAHPCHLRDNPHTLIRELVGLGLQGLEVYYPSSTPKQTELYRSLAKQHGLLITCGSDHHGKNRPGVPLGCAWRETPELEKTYQFFAERA
ncbi:MAG: PHP domain-containing protein [Clostridiales bacterium]|nr:PHP domain-containing protein [Clostridiales bacterium]